MKYKLLSILSVLVLVGTLNSGFVLAAEKKELEQTGFSPQGYSADSNLQTGTVIQPDDKDSTKVKPATQDALEKAFGVVVSTNTLPISITSTGSSNQVFIATNGRRDVLVTTENGPIKSGDFLAVSSLTGTLMKSNEKQKLVFGKALASFDGKGSVMGKATLKDKQGKPFKEIAIGRIPVAIEIMKNPEDKSTKVNLPDMLQRIGKAVAEKEVSPVRVYISTAIITLTIIVALMLLYSGVRSAIISIGRNPLSKKSIFRALLEVILTSVLVLIIGLFTVYLLLRL